MNIFITEKEFAEVVLPAMQVDGECPLMQRSSSRLFASTVNHDAAR
jgi:hypothetical protein